MVRFAVTDFTAEELSKMQSFGVPIIRLMRLINIAGRGITRQNFNQGVTQINENSVMQFDTEAEANDYEKDVLEQIRQVMTSLRDRKDEFTSSEEVDI